MRFEYLTPQYRYVFVFRKDLPDYVDIQTYEPKYSGGSAWLHKIKDGEIIWRTDEFCRLTPDAKRYISKIVKLLAFA